MTSVSVQNGVSPHQQNLRMSRMSAGFADISQLADEEKEQLDQLIERLDEERRRVAATTELLSSARAPPIQNRPSSGENERNRLKNELKNVREYNRELERELEDMRFNLHSDNHSHALSPQGVTPSPIHTTERPHSSPVYYNPNDTIPKLAYTEHINDFPQGTHNPIVPFHSAMPFHTSPDEGMARSQGGRIPDCPPRMRSQSYETGASNSYQSPMKAHPELNVSSSGNFVINGGEPPMNIPIRKMRSHGNSPMPNGDPQMREAPHRGAFVPRQLLPDAPLIKMSHRQPQSISPASSMRSSKSQISKHRESPKIFDGASPEMMFKSLNTSSTVSDRRSESNPALSSHGTLTKHRLSPALQQAYQRHLEATGQAGMSDKSWQSSSRKSISQKSSRHSSKDYESYSLSGSARSTPKFHSSQEQPLIDLASSANISSDSLGSSRQKIKPVAMEAQLIPVETGGLLHSFERGVSPVGRHSRSSTPKVSNISAYVKEPGDLMGSYGSAGFPQRQSSPASALSHESRPKSRHSRSRTSTPKMADEGHRTGPKKFVDSFASGITSNSGTLASRESGSRKSTQKVTDASSSDVDPPCVVKRDSHGSFVPPRRVLSQENLNFQRQPTRSFDSDSLLTSSPNHSVGFSAGDSSDAEVHRTSHPTYLKEFDPYSSLNASAPKEKISHNLRNSPKTTPNKGITSDSGSTQETSPTITPSSQSFVSDAGFEVSLNSHNVKYTRNPNAIHDVSSHSLKSSAEHKINKKFPHNLKHESHNREEIRNDGSNIHSSMSDTGVKMHETSSQNLSNNSSSTKQPSTTVNSCDHSSASDRAGKRKKHPKPIKPQRNSSKKHREKAGTSKPHHSRSHSNTSSKHNTSANSSRKSSPKMTRQNSTSSSDEEDVKTDTKILKSGTCSSSKSSDGSRSTPDGDIEKEFQRSEAEPRFESPEEEMKHIITKLQKLMPSMFDENADPENCSSVEKVHPMTEVLVAAEQTRKAIELFTEYAIAASAGEGTFL